ncbi:SHOCT domain-containing protein [Halomonas alkalisoli]|uniref:SHOCT domain-containing protein n=1 Tax=Halomonas alkalisoli TaxID=2907158 RepID=UPI001F31BC37|nr:SHOCT domain-containing protein [Halomonas alkalisoli]MCE9683056.1 SHOCT domain-containing protein [Halomonas alkalisoli]
MNVFKALSLASIIIILSACSSPAPRQGTDSSDWIEYNNNVTYSIDTRSEDEAYLTVRYVTYTFLDKSSEMVPTAKSNFMAIARDLAGAERNAQVDESMFYKSLGYNGITGISSVIVSNDVRFSSLSESNGNKYSASSSTLRERLIELNHLRVEGLITNEEYERLREKALQGHYSNE